MKKSITILIVLFFLKGFSQPPVSDTTYNYWKGKRISYQQLRDSIERHYLVYCDSLKKSHK